MNVVEALGAEDGMVCFVGAGGKKSAMYTLAERIDRATVTATVRIPLFDSQVDRVITTTDPVSVLDDNDTWPVGVVPERERDDRYRGYDPEVIEALAEADIETVVLVKADGARTRQFKAPGEHEPQIPRNADTVVSIASARVVGKALTEEYVHRVERVATLTGLDPGETIRIEDVVTVLTSDAGGLKGVPADASFVPLVNMADNPNLETTAREIAAGIHDRINVPRVVLTQLTADDPLVGVVE